MARARTTAAQSKNEHLTPGPAKATMPGVDTSTIASPDHAPSCYAALWDPTSKLCMAECALERACARRIWFHGLPEAQRTLGSHGDRESKPSLAEVAEDVGIASRHIKILETRVLTDLKPEPWASSETVAADEAARAKEEARANMETYMENNKTRGPAHGRDPRNPAVILCQGAITDTTRIEEDSDKITCRACKAKLRELVGLEPEDDAEQLELAPPAPPPKKAAGGKKEKEKPPQEPPTLVVPGAGREAELLALRRENKILRAALRAAQNGGQVVLSLEEIMGLMV